MAGLKKSPAFLGRLKNALVATLGANGIQAKVKTTPIPTTKLYRVAVFAPQFKRMKPSERQNLVWRIAEHTLPQEEQMRISMILTLTDNEAKNAWP